MARVRRKVYDSVKTGQWEREFHLTTNSGAAKHAMGRGSRRYFTFQYKSPREAAIEFRYIAASGPTMNKKGRQVVSAKTRCGQICCFKAQVTNVHKPRMSVSRICDEGHEVVFDSKGGYI